MKSFLFVAAIPLVGCGHAGPRLPPFSSVHPLPALCAEQEPYAPVHPWICIDANQGIYLCDKMGKCLKEAPSDIIPVLVPIR